LVFYLLLIPTFLFSQPALTNKTISSIEKDTVALRYSENISAEDMSINLHVLASDEYEGRETGKKGQKMAAEYIANQFKMAGIPPYKKNSYYQEFLLNLILPETTDIIVKGKKFKGNEDFYNYPEQTERHFETTDIEFLGYGIEEENYHDYKGIDVKDKVVMILAGEPFTKDSLSLITGKKEKSVWSINYKAKQEKAKEKGVKILLIVVDDVAKDILDNKHRIETPSLNLELNNEEMFVIYISKKMADDILKKERIKTIQQKISRTQKPFSIAVKTNFVINTKNKVQKVSSENVLAYIEGSGL